MFDLEAGENLTTTMSSSNGCKPKESKRVAKKSTASSSRQTSANLGSQASTYNSHASETSSYTSNASEAGSYASDASQASSYDSPGSYSNHGTQTSTYATRSQSGLASSKTARTKHKKNLRSTATDRFLENFDPDNSTRERRKLNRKIHPPGALYDENGVHIATGIDLCDCLNEECVGCFFECESCGSPKCGLECRVHRKFVYEQIAYHGYDVVVKNPLLKH